MPNTGIKESQVDLAKAAMVLNLLRDDGPTASYVTGCLMHGFALRILHDVRRPHEEILTSTITTLEEYEQAEKRIIQPATR